MVPLFLYNTFCYSFCVYHIGTSLSSVPWIGKTFPRNDFKNNYVYIFNHFITYDSYAYYTSTQILWSKLEKKQSDVFSYRDLDSISDHPYIHLV